MGTVMDYVNYWIDGIRKPEKTVKKLQKKKLMVMDGIMSIGLLALIVGIVIFLFVALLVSISPLEVAPGVAVDSGTILIAMFMVLVILLPILAIAGLIAWVALFRLVAEKLGGKGKFDKEVGFFGILAGMMVIAMAPMYILMAIGMFGGQYLYLFCLGLGGLITGALNGIVAGLMYEMLSSMEKTSLPRTGLLIGLTYGVVMFIVMLIMVALVGVSGATLGLEGIAGFGGF